MCKAAYSPNSWIDSEELELPSEVSLVLDSLRVASARDGTSAGINPVETCELLELDRYAPARTYVTALSMSLTEAIGEAPKLNAPGCAHYSFDEAWLMRLLERSCAADAESVAFLISSRVPHRYRNAIAFLVNGLVSRIDQNRPVSDAI